MSLDSGRKVYETAKGEQVFETTPRAGDINFKVWLQNQREGKIAFALSNHNADEARRIGGLSDEDLAKELGVIKLPIKKGETDPSSSQQVA